MHDNTLYTSVRICKDLKVHIFRDIRHEMDSDSRVCSVIKHYK